MNNKVIELASKANCTGCGACIDACPHSCITMVQDGLHYYPHINQDNCIGCRICMTTCPSINGLDCTGTSQQKYYACINKDRESVKASTSGGVGTALAEYAIENGYYVAGVRLSNDGTVNHSLATTKEEILDFRGSKYVQSNCNGIYKECLKAIKDGNKVLFIGTPCQTEAIKRILPPQFSDDLITCSIICHGVNSPIVWSDYKNHIEIRHKSTLESYNFRCKSHGWQKKAGGPNLRVSYKMNSGAKKDEPSWRNLFHYWFGQHYIMRPSCFKCIYRTEERHSDLVIGDFWNIERVLDGMDTFNGVSVLITTTPKGEGFVKNNPYLNMIAVDTEKTKSALKGFINRKTESIQDKEIQIMESFEKEYCNYGFDYMRKHYHCPSYLKQIVNKIKSLL